MQGFCCTHESGYRLRSNKATRAGRLYWYQDSYAKGYIPTEYTEHPVSAHCMRMAFNGGNWSADPNGDWSDLTGYPRTFEDPHNRVVEISDIYPPVATFELVVKVDTALATSPAATETASEITLFQNPNDGPDPPSSQRKGANTTSLPLSAQLIGYHSSWTFPSLGASKAIVAKKPWGKSNEITKNDVMVIPDSLWSDDGYDCNKVGVDFIAFRCAHGLTSPALCLHQVAQSGCINSLFAPCLASRV